MKKALFGSQVRKVRNLFPACNCEQKSGTQDEETPSLPDSSAAGGGSGSGAALLHAGLSPACGCDAADHARPAVTLRSGAGLGWAEGARRAAAWGDDGVLSDAGYALLYPLLELVRWL